MDSKASVNRGDSKAAILMALKFIQGPTYPQLGRALEARIEKASAAEPLAPRWIVTPTTTVAGFLRYRLSRKARAHPLLAARILSAPLLVRQLQSRAEIPPASRWSASHDLLLREAVARLPDQSALSPLKTNDQGFSRLQPALIDLGEAGLGADDLDYLEDVAAQAEDLNDLERETLRFYCLWISILHAAEVPWQPLQQQKLNHWVGSADSETVRGALAAESGQRPVLEVYGFYEFTDLNLELLSLLSRHIEVNLYHPGVEDPGKEESIFRFANRTREQLELRDPRAEREFLPMPERGSGRFFLDTFPRGGIGDRPRFVSYRRAAGIEAETWAAALQIQEWIDSESIRPTDILLVAPDIASYYGPLRIALKSFGIPLKVMDLPLAESGRSRPLDILHRLWEDSAPFEWLVSYLRDYPDVAARKGVSSSALERKLRRAKLVGGESWVRLKHFVLTSDSEWLSARETQLVDEIVRLFVEAEDFMGLDELSGYVSNLQEWLPEDSLLEPFLEMLHDFKTSRPDLKISLADLFHILKKNHQQENRSDSMNQDAVALTSIMRARGLWAKKLVFLGLTSERFPERIQEDPLLSDRSRFRLMRSAQDLGHHLPVKSNLTEEMVLLFFLLNTAAEEVHWVIPETDNQGRALAPTPWIQRYLHRWTGEGSGRIPRSPSEQALYLLQQDPAGGTRLPPALAPLLDLPAGEPEEKEREEILPGRVPILRETPPGRSSVTRLEKLAHCPFRFWAEEILRLRALDPLRWEGELTPLERGSLVHAILQELFTPFCGAKTTVAEAASHLLDEGEEKINRTLAELPTRSTFSFRFLPTLFQEANLRPLRRLLLDTLTFLRADESGYRVQAVEEKVSASPAKGELEVSGILDRVDRRGNKLRVVDYKTGRRFKKTAGDEEFQLGLRLQPFLYPWLLSRKEESGEDFRFAYLFLGESPPVEQEIPPLESVEEVLLRLEGLLSRGHFLPLSTQVYDALGLDRMKPCTFCDLTSTCRRYERNQIPIVIKTFREHFPDRLAELYRVFQQENSP